MTNDKFEEERLKMIEKQMKSLGIPRSCLVVGEEFNVPHEWIPTGIVEIDSILGDFSAIPAGTLVEFCGEPQSGKTHVAMKLIAEAQKQGKRAVYCNVENAFFEPRANALGVNTRDFSKFLMLKEIDTAEKWGDMVRLLVESGQYAVIVIDSITALVPEVEMTKSLSDNPKIGVHAQFINRMQKQLLQACSTSGTIVVLINQFRMGQGAMAMQMVKTPTGGASVGYLCHMRLWFDRIRGAAGKIIGEDGEEVVGGKSKVYLAKTRFGEPEQTTIFPIYYKEANVNLLGEFLYVAQSRGKEYIKVYRKKYQYIDKDTGEVYGNTIDPIEFVKLLLTLPPPADKPKKDTSTNVFDYICNRLKYTPEQNKQILEYLDKPDAGFDAPDDLNKITGPSKIEYPDEEID